MNLANRLGVSVLLLIVIGVAVLLALAPAPLEAPLQIALMATQRRLDALTQLLVSLGALAVAFIALVLLVAEWRRPSRRAVVVARTPGGTAELAIESISVRLKHAAESVPGVREASPLVGTRRGGIEVVMRLSADSDLDLPEKSKEVMDAVRSEAEGKMGIAVKSLRVSFKHSSQGSRPQFPAGRPSNSTGN